MIPSVARGSTSLTEAERYYLYDKSGRGIEQSIETRPVERAGDYALHDKRGKRTSHRVGFVELLNLDAPDGFAAVQEMQARFDAFRTREKHKRGRKLQKPIYTYSLSWAPHETPSRETMMAAARSSLAAVGLGGLQTLVVQHIDEPQPHVHVIVNRIEPNGLRARNIAWDHLHLSRWAEAYEREHGQVLCSQRAINNANRQRGIFVKDKKSLSRQDYEKARGEGRPKVWQPPKTTFSTGNRSCQQTKRLVISPSGNPPKKPSNLRRANTTMRPRMTRLSSSEMRR